MKFSRKYSTEDVIFFRRDTVFETENVSHLNLFFLSSWWGKIRVPSKLGYFGEKLQFLHILSQAEREISNARSQHASWRHTLVLGMLVLLRYGKRRHKTLVHEVIIIPEDFFLGYVEGEVSTHFRSGKWCSIWWKTHEIWFTESTKIISKVR